MPTLDIPIAASSDDAQQIVGGGNNGVIDGINIATRDGFLAGFRFIIPDIPQGATIDVAYITFRHQGQSYNYNIQVENTANASTFAATANNLGARSLTGSAVNHAGSAPSAGDARQTPSLAALVQGRVNDGAWSPGNAIAFLTTSSFTDANGQVRSYDNTTGGNPQGFWAPILHIEYTADDGFPVWLAIDANEVLC